MTSQVEAARALLAAIVENSNDAIITRDLDGIITSWNPAASRLFGWRADEAIGRHVRMIVPEERRGEYEHYRERVERGVPVPAYDTVRVAKDGTRIPVSLALSAVKDGSGKVMAVSLVLHDVSERKRAESARAELAAIVENSHDAIVGRSLAGIITSWNAGAERLFGYTAAEAIGRPVTFLLPPGEAPRWIQNTNTVLTGRHVAPFEAQRRAKDGRLISVLISVSPVRDLAGRVTGASAIFHDITQLKRAEANRAQLAAIVESSEDAIVSRTLDYRILTWNPAAERLFGWTAAEVIGRDSQIMIPPEVREQTERNRAEIAAGRPVRTFETVRMTRDGRRLHVTVTPSAIRNEAGEVTAVSLVFHDISERKRLEAEAARKAALSALLESLARAANEAATPAEAMRRCLEHICAYGRWSVGCVGTFAHGQSGGIPVSHSWHVAEPSRYAEFMHVSEQTHHSDSRGHFVGRVLRERSPVWLEDISGLDAPGRIGLAARLGLRAAFAFPVLVGKDVAAFLEFFSEESRPPEQLFLDAIGSIGSQLARVIERERAHATLRESEHLMRLVTENTPAMLAYFDAELRCRFANVAFCDFHHVDPQGIIGLTLREIVGEATWSVISPTIEAVKRGQPVILRREERLPSGEQRHIEIRRLPDMGPDGGFRGYYAMLLDVTDSVRAEAAIKASEMRLRTILDSEPECVKVINADGTLADMNRAGLEMLEASSIEEVRRRGLINFALPQYRRPFLEMFERTMMRGERCTLEFEIMGLRGTRRWMETHTAPLPPAGDGAGGMLAVTRDITARKRAEERADYLASHDGLTALPSRTLFRSQLALTLARAKRTSATVGVLVVDLDGFTEVNESLGDDAGDRLLQQVARRLREGLREVDTIGRLGGDTFGVLLEAVSDHTEAEAVAEKINRLFDGKFEVGGRDIFLSVSIGGDICEAGACDADGMMQQAELALWQVAREGGNGHQIWRAHSGEKRGASLDIKTRLRRAVGNGELLLHYQPKIDFASGRICGAEALLRWDNPDLGMVSPARFIPLAEESGLILEIGEWVLRTACRDGRAWHDLGMPIEIAVNLSPRQFRHKDLVGMVIAALRETDFGPDYLELEITESSMMSRPEDAIVTLRALREVGVLLAVDDFGTGYSSLAYLKRFPLHRLKIDQTFVADVGSEPDSETIVTSTIALAHGLRLKCSAEGVETEEQRGFLAAAGCDEYQGYLFSKPLPKADFEALLRLDWRVPPVLPFIGRPVRKKSPRRARRKG